VGDWSSSDGRLGKGAAWYAKERGWQILPVHGINKNGKCTCGKEHKDAKEIGKHPPYGRWNEEATSDPQQIESWWEQNPDYNVGVYCKGSGFIVIDVDPRSGGDESYLKLEALAQGALPPTVEAITGSHSDKGVTVRGRHFIYKCDPSEKFIGNFKSEGLTGIDVKHNGYILIAPSRHFSGVTYEWKPGHAPWEMEIADAPEELLAVIRAKNRKGRSGAVSTRYTEGDWSSFNELEYDGEKVDIDNILNDGLVEGERATGIYQLTCALANKYGTDSHSAQFIETNMIRFNAEKITPPLELEGTNGLLMHVRRAIEFVRNNPIVDKGWAEVSKWVQEQGMEWAKSSQREVLKPIVVGSEDSSEEFYDEDSTASSMPDNYVGMQVKSYAESGMSATDITSNGNLNVPKDPDAVSARDGGLPGKRSLTDTGNGRRLVDTYEAVIRYSEGLGWFYWDGNYWKPDPEQLEIKELSKRVAAVVASEVRHYTSDATKQGEIINWAKQTKSVARISNMVASANSDGRIRVPVSRWDADSNLIGVKNGVVNLQTGELMTGRPDLSITKRAAVDYVPGLLNVRWNQFLEHATGGDKEYEAWLQRAVGYTLTGMSNEDVLLLVYGPPGSGKNTFVETIFNALGHSDYSMMLDSNVLIAGDNRRDSSDQYYMAELRGKRMVWVDELPEGDRIKENQVKKMTGSTNLTGRSPGERPFTFQSRAKLWVTTNHRPIITDDAMWRRLRVLPLTNIPVTPDPTLKEYLSDPEGGLPAVFSWAVEGAVKYLNWSSSKSALDIELSAVIKAANENYRKNEDRIGAFLAEETVENEGGAIMVNELFQSYRMWSEGRNERPLTQIAFQRKLVDRGLPIEGDASKAVLLNHSRTIKQVAAPPVEHGEQNWNAMIKGM
jgi:P4 family phage/plasmid primase-like protien